MLLNMDLQIWYEGYAGFESVSGLKGVADVVHCLDDLDGLSLELHHCGSNVGVRIH